VPVSTENAVSAGNVAAYEKKLIFEMSSARRLAILVLFALHLGGSPRAQAEEMAGGIMFMFLQKEAEIDITSDFSAHAVAEQFCRCVPIVHQT